MPAFSQKLFYGMAPRSGSRVRRAGFSEKALDVDLNHGEIRPLRTNSVVQSAPAGTKSIYKLDCCFLTFDSCVSVADGACDDRAFITGSADYPESIATTGCEIDSCRLGMPCKFSAPDAQAAAAATLTKDHAAKSYVYCYKNKWGEISAPSYPSDIVYVKDGDAVVLSGFAAQDPSYCITSILIYRTETSKDRGNETTNAANSASLLVAEIPATQGSYSDTVLAKDLGTALETEGFAPPPKGLQGISRIKDLNVLFGFDGKQLHFSEINNFHHWPDEQVITLDDTVRAVCEVDGQIYVATDGFPYTVGAAPADNGSREVFKHKVAHRMIGDKKGFAALPNGMVYVSEVGVILLGGKSIPTILTDAYLAPSDWQQLQPHSIHLQYWNSDLYIFGKVKSFSVRIPRTGEAAEEAHGLIQITDMPTDSYVDRRNQMFLLQNGQIEHFRNGTAYRNYIYRSTETHLGGDVSMTSAKVMGSGNVAIEMFNEARSRLNRPVRMNRIFRLPRQGKWIDLVYELRGTGIVKSVEIGTSHIENSAN
jgi:hypothetical protein